MISFALSPGRMTSSLPAVIRCCVVQEKGLDTEGKFKAWWGNNLDPDEMMMKVSNMKVRVCLA